MGVATFVEGLRNEAPTSAIAPHDPPDRGGDLAALIRGMDWSTTPTGPVEGWSATLRMIVDLLLANRFPHLLWWGPEYVSIYNDAYSPILGAKHPWALGRPFREVWSEIDHILRPLIDTPFNGGPPTWMDDIELEINRHGYFEETHFTVAYSPVPDPTAPRGIGGVLATVTEITDKIVGERRIAALRDLGVRAGEARTAEEACAVATLALRGHDKDIPFALIYLLDEDGEPRLAASTDAPNWSQPRADWPFAEVLATNASVTVEHLDALRWKVPAGPWSDPPDAAVVLPVRSGAAQLLAGFVVAGISARLRLDEQYRSFLDLVAAQISAAVTNAHAYAEERKRAEALDRTARERELSPGQHTAICVIDTGTGMTEEVIEKAFDPFFTTKPVGQGTGLGLSMVYGFVRQSGGQVEIYSELGRGTTMRLDLPRYMGPMEDSPDGETASGVQPGGSETVLVVDDEPTLVMLISDALEEYGYKVLSAKNGAAALKPLQSDLPIDLLITDVGLPGGMNGRQLADAARKLRPRLKILFVTGFAENAGQDRLGPGMDLLAKPFEIAKLAAKVRALIEP